MNELSHPYLLRPITGLNGYPEITALEMSLMATLRGRIAADRLLFYELRAAKTPASRDMYLLPIGEGGNPDRQETVPLLLSEHAEFSECLHTLEMAAAPIADAASVARFRFIHPVICAKGARSRTNGVIGFVVVEAAKHLPRDQELIAILLGFHRNYSALLQDNQRDHLTGLLNRKSFDDHMMKIILSLSDAGRRKADKIDYCVAVLS